MKKGFAVVAWLLVLGLIVGFTFYADAVTAQAKERPVCADVIDQFGNVLWSGKDHVCAECYEKDGVMYYPESCFWVHDIPDLKNGDKLICENGGYATISCVTSSLAIDEEAIELGIYNKDGSKGPNYNDYAHMLEGMAYSSGGCCVSYD